MPTLREWLRRLLGTIRPGRRDRDLEDELRSHLALAADARGHGQAPAHAATRSARLDAVGLLQALDALRDQRGVPWVADLARDVRHGLRTFRRSPLFASVAVLTLALGIGANTAIFSLADAALLRPLPVTRPRTLVLLRQQVAGSSIFPFTSAAAEHLAQSRDVLAGLAVFRPLLNAHVAVDGEPEQALAQLISGNYHAVLGVRVVLGRAITEQDRDPVAVISTRYWRRRFGGRADVLGRAVELNGRPFTIVGVTGQEFFGTQPGRHVDVTVPLSAGSLMMGPNARWLYLIGRLAPGVSREQAQVALHARWTQLAPSGSQSGAPGAQSGPPVTLEVEAGAQGLNELRREFSMPLRLLMAAMGVVLLLASANLAGLLIVRSSARQQEMAVRLALGAGRWRIVRQLLTESALLSAMGAAAGFVLAHQTTGLLLAMLSRGRTPIALDVTPNVRTLVFAAAVTVLTTILFALLPALTNSQVGLRSRVREGGHGPAGRGGWGRAMAAVQVALLVVLLTSAGLFVRTLQKLRSVDAGLQQHQVLAVGIPRGPGARGAIDRAVSDDLQARLSALPGVQSVSVSMDTPFGGEMSMAAGMTVPGRPAVPPDAPPVYHNFVGPRFFETMGIPLLAGRDFGPGDEERGPRAVIVSASLARRYFGDLDPIGRQVHFVAVTGPAEVTASVIGVAKDVRYTSLRTDAPLVLYRPARQDANAPAHTVLIRTTSSDAAAVAPSVRAILRTAAPALPPPSIVRAEDQLAAALVGERMLAFLSSAIGGLAAVLAAIGIYSTAASTVGRRRREIGIRLALGAHPEAVVQMIVRDVAGMVLAGLGVGVLASVVAGQAARGVLGLMLFELSPSNPFVLATSVATILLVACLAAYLPVRRASRIDPVAVIRQD